MDSDLNGRIGEALARLAQAMRSLGWRAAVEAGVNPTQAAVLGCLLRHDANRVGDIAVEMGVSQPTITDSVVALERKALVEKRPDPRDGRGRILALTPMGEKLAAQLADLPAEMLAALNGLSLNEREGLIVGMTRLMQQLEGEGALRSARVCYNCKHSSADMAAGDPYYCLRFDRPLRLQDLQANCPAHEPAE